jgi:outer membrane receptor protein involved in Fe transport
MSPNHPEAVAGEIAVESGDRIPLIPRQLLKAGVRFAASDVLTFGADVLASSGAFFRGDEGNLLDELDAYSVLGVRAEYRLSEHASVFASVDNLLDEEYEKCSATSSTSRTSWDPARRARRGSASEWSSNDFTGEQSLSSSRSSRAR